MSVVLFTASNELRCAKCLGPISVGEVAVKKVLRDRNCKKKYKNWVRVSYMHIECYNSIVKRRR